MTTLDLLGSADEPDLLALNNRHAVELSWLEPADWGRLVASAYHARTVPDRTAFLIALERDADYASPNFLWFRDRFDRFVYVDRVVVAAEARGRGLARVLYDDLFARARSDGHSVVCCEVNLEPPNPASLQFHDRLGFVEAGQADLASGKRVRYLVRRLR